MVVNQSGACVISRDNKLGRKYVYTVRKIYSTESNRHMRWCTKHVGVICRYHMSTLPLDIDNIQKEIHRLIHRLMYNVVLPLKRYAIANVKLCVHPSNFETFQR